MLFAHCCLHRRKPQHEVNDRLVREALSWSCLQPILWVSSTMQASDPIATGMQCQMVLMSAQPELAPMHKHSKASGDAFQHKQQRPLDT